MKRILAMLCCTLLACSAFSAFAGCSRSNSTSSVVSSHSASPSPSPNTGSSSQAGSSLGSALIGTGALADLRDAVMGAFGTFYYPDTEIDAEKLKTDYGLTEDMYDDIYAEHSAMDDKPDVLIIVKAKQGKADEVEAALEKYRTDLAQKDTLDENARLKAEAGQVYKEGDYVVLMILGDTDDAALTGSELSKAYQESMKKGTAALEEYFKK